MSFLFVLDASVVIEYLIELRWPNAATSVFRRALDGKTQFWAPDLVFPETVSVIRRLLHQRIIDAKTAKRAIEWLPALPISIASCKPLVPSIWALRERATPYDGSYLALAHSLSATLITGDERLSRIKQPKVQIITLAKIEAEGLY